MFFSLSNVYMNSNGGRQQKPRTPSTVDNLEEKLIEVMDIFQRNEEYVTTIQRKDAVNDIINLIAPNEFGAVFVRLQATSYPMENDAFRRLLLEAYGNRLTGGKKRKRTMKKKHRKSRTYRRKK